MATLRKLHRAILTLDDGREVEVERIGKGRYTTAWANGTRVYLQTYENDASKEILAGLNVAPRNPHIPDCCNMGYLEGEPYRLFSMPKYRKVTARQTPQAWRQLKALIAMRGKAWDTARQRAGLRTDGRDINDEFRELLQGPEGDALPPTLRAALNQLLDAAANYGEYTIEFSRANVAADDDGALILLDPLFDMAEVRKDQQRRQRAARGTKAMSRETVNPGQTFTEIGQLLNGECGAEYNYTAVRAGVVFQRRACFTSRAAFYACIARWNRWGWQYSADDSYAAAL